MFSLLHLYFYENIFVRVGAWVRESWTVFIKPFLPQMVIFSVSVSLCHLS